MEILESKGYVYFDWNVDSKDALAVTQKKEVILDSVLNNIPKNTSPIILFHDLSSKTTTVDALPQIIKVLKSRGYKFEALTNEAVPVQFFY